MVHKLHILELKYLRENISRKGSDARFLAEHARFSGGQISEHRVPHVDARAGPWTILVKTVTQVVVFWNIEF